MPIEVSCEVCGKKLLRYPSHLHGHIWCSHACHAIGKRKDAERETRRMRKASGHPIAPAGGLVAEARFVLYEKVGPGPHPCHWCGKVVPWVVGQKGNVDECIVADHLNADPLNDSPENLVVSCGRCNRTRGARVPDDELFIVRANGDRLRVGQRRTCRTCGGEFETTGTYRNYCSRSCQPSRAKKKAASAIRTPRR
jgi:hypothetical protein